jgi:hypothetical protein
MNIFSIEEVHRAAEDRAKATPSGLPKYRGLCSTCEHRATCTYPRDPDQRIHYCCEHDGYQESEGSVSLALLGTGRASSHLPTSPRNDEALSTAYKGLCRSCQNRDTCTFPKPEGGVWHCEEYQ